MYETFYGLKEKPFSMIPDPEYLFLSPKHQRALTLLEYGMMNQAGFSVICGDTGAGKTTLIRRLLNELGDDTVVGLITNTHQSFGELLNWVLMAFGIDSEDKSKSQMHQIFVSFLVEQYAKNKHAVLIVDEAQNMSADTLEELRMLSNINSDKDQVLQVVLAGQPALRETLRKPELMQFAQRIAVDYYLEALNKEETSTYIKHRLKIAGAEGDIFTEEACTAIYNYSGGTPRLINLLADTSLVYGFAEQSKTVDVDIVNDVVREQHSHSVVPTYRKQHPQKDIGEIKKSKEVRHEISKEESQESTADITEDVTNKLDKGVSEAHEHYLASAIDQKKEKIKVSAEDNKLEASQSKDDLENGVSGVSDQVEETPLMEKTQEIEVDKDENIETIEPSSEKEQEEPRIKSEEENLDYYRETNSRGNRRRDDLYPVIQVEEQTKSNINGLIIGFSGGMFLASILLVVFVFMYGIKAEVEPVSVSDDVLQQDKMRNNQRLVEDDQLKAIQKERDAALAIGKALERERDAALAAAKSQQEMRAAEMRAAEIIAGQERSAAREVKRAKERARQAEMDAAKSREREKLALERVELERLKAEKIKLEKEMARIEAEKIDATQKELNKVVAESSVLKVENTSKSASSSVAESSKSKKEKGSTDNNKFIRNPCDSPSAKFLSTCKK